MQSRIFPNGIEVNLRHVFVRSLPGPDVSAGNGVRADGGKSLIVRSCVGGVACDARGDSLRHAVMSGRRQAAPLRFMGRSELGGSGRDL
jgi:hypothetical protein